MTKVEKLHVSAADCRIDGTKDFGGGDPAMTKSNFSEPDKTIISMVDIKRRTSMLEPRQRRRGKYTFGNFPSSFNRSDSATSNCSEMSSGSDNSGGHCPNIHVTKQCELIRHRRQYDPLVRWCVREGLLPQDSPLGPVDNTSTRSRSARSSMFDVSSVLTTFSYHQELLSDIVDEGFSDDESSDDDDQHLVSRIPSRFHPSAQQTGNTLRDADDRPPTSDAGRMTQAGELFWKDHRLRGLSGWTYGGNVVPDLSRRKSNFSDMKPVPARTSTNIPDNRRRSSSVVRQMAFSYDSIDGAVGKPYPFARAKSEPLSDVDFPDESDGRQYHHSMDISDEYGSCSESDETGSSSVGDRASLAAVDHVTVLRSQLENVVRLSKTSIPLHFWPSMKTELGVASSGSEGNALF